MLDREVGCAGHQPEARHDAIEQHLLQKGELEFSRESRATKLLEPLVLFDERTLA